MLTIERLNHVRKCAEEEIDKYMEEHPGQQVPAFKGPDTLELVDELIKSGRYIQASIPESVETQSFSVGTR